MTPFRALRFRLPLPPAAGLAVAVVLVLAAGCDRANEGPPPGAVEQRQPAPRPVLAEQAVPRVGGRLQVTAISHIAPDLLVVRLLMVNPGTTSFTLAQAFGRPDRGPSPLAEASLAEPDGARKYFVLRDSSGQPQCSAGIVEVPSGRSQAVWLRFPAPGPGR